MELLSFLIASSIILSLFSCALFKISLSFFPLFNKLTISLNFSWGEVDFLAISFYPKYTNFLNLNRCANFPYISNTKNNVWKIKYLKWF